MLLLVRRFQSVITNGGIHRSLEKVDEKIKAMHERGLVVRVANKSVDAGELVSSCQAIKDALDTFYVGCFFFSTYRVIDLFLGWAQSIGGKEHTQDSEGVLSHL